MSKLELLWLGLGLGLANRVAVWNQVEYIQKERDVVKDSRRDSHRIELLLYYYSSINSSIIIVLIIIVIVI